jgi:hypothetical protein
VKINIGNFGYSEREVTPVVDKSGVGNALIAAGGRLQNQLDDIQRNREALQRAKAANAAVSYQLAIEETGRGLEEDLASGAVNWENADAEYGERVKKLEVPQFELDNPIDRENSDNAIAHAQERGRLAIQPQVFAARQRDGVAQLDQFFDTQAKRAIEPGADVDQINASADAFAANAREYGIPADVLARRVQDFKDANYFNQATQRAVEADEDLKSLRAVLYDVTAEDGYYAKRLDPTKRNALQASIQNRIDRIEDRARAALDRREARAERAIVQMERQISSAIPWTPEMLTDWAKTVDGTSSQADFNALVNTERQVQQVLRQPIGDQVRMVQEAEAKLLQEGGTVAQGANVARLKNAVESNVKLLTQSPIEFGEKRLGDKNTPIDVGDIVNPESRQAATSVLQERASRIRALGKQFGAPVPMRPLLPQESKQVAQLLEKGSPTQAADIYGLLYETAGTPEVYRGIMQQIAPDSPVRAIAGLFAGKRAELVTESHWFKPDDIVMSRDVAATMLEGDRLLNRSSTARSEDGKAQTKLVLPETKLLQDEFAKQVGTTFRGRPQDAELAFQAAQAYYAGRVAQTGKIAAGTDDVDTDLVRESVRATIGNIVDFNGRGDVAAPWGMAEDDFDDRVYRALAGEMKRRGMGEPTDAQRALVGLINGGADGVYGVTIGQRLMRDDGGNPVMIDLRRGGPVARGYIERP